MKVAINRLCLAFMVGDTTATVMAESDAAPPSVSGRVMDLFGAPLPDAVVEVTTGNSSQKFSVRAKQDGSYLVRDLPVGEVTLAVRSQGFRPETDTLFLLG